MNKSLLRNSYILYTCIFILLLPIIFFSFLSEGRSFVWHMDGIDQHYPALMYYCKLLRGILTGHGFPMVDFNIGMGFDTLTTLNYYVIGDPIGLLTVFMNNKNGVFFYDFLVLLRLYLAGISFMIFMRYFKKEGLPTVLGALIYIFCGYAFYAGLRHPFFMNPMIYLPLILLGVELILRKRKPYLLILMVFISTLSNFYFFYDLTIITVIYVLFRYFTLYRKDYKNIVTGLFITGLKTGGFYLLGVALASFLFIPVLYAFSLNGRLGDRPGMVHGYLLYGLKYYSTLLQSIITPESNPKYWSVLSFPVITAVSLSILFTDKKYRRLQMIYLLSFIGLSVPAFGYFMNGFSYDANRWCFLVSLLVAISFTMTYDKIFDMDYVQRLVLLIITGIYGIFAFLFSSRHVVQATFFMLFAIMIIIFVLQMEWFKNKKTWSGSILFFLVLISILFNGYGFFAKGFNHYSAEFLTKAEVNQLTHEGELSLLSYIKDDSFYRIETYGDKALNSSLTENFHDVSAYYSLMDGDITAYLKDLEVLNQITAFRFENMDNRAVLDTLACVKYFITTDKTAAPYGFQLVKELASGPAQYYLFQNSTPLPIAYTYDTYLLRSDYNQLNSLQKQNVQLSSVILDQSTDYVQANSSNPAAGIEKLDAKIMPDGNITMSQNLIHVLKGGATITLDFTAKPNTESYIRLGNFNIVKKEDIMIDFYAKGSQGALKKINVRSPYYNSYFGKVNYLVNTGYSATGEMQAVITFTEKRDYSYDSLEVFSVDMSNYSSQIQALTKSSLGNVQLSNNKIQGNITLDKKGILAFSIPYSTGWSAIVDGQKAKLIPANIMYMALPLDAGAHQIVLNYETPFLKVGILVSIAALMILIGIVVYRKGDKRGSIRSSSELS